MPITEAGITVTPATDRIQAIRDNLDADLAALGLPALNYDGTLEDAITSVVGVIQFDVESGQPIILDATDPNTATGANLDRLASQFGVLRRAATATRQTFRATASSAITYPAGYTVQFTDANDAVRTFATVEATAVTSDTPVVFECADTGPIAIDSAQTGASVRPYPGLVSVTYNPADGDPISLGRNRESDTQLRVRLRATRGASAGPTEPGIRAGLLAISWVQAVSLARVGPAQVAVTVVPGPVGADQIATLGEAIGRLIGFGIVTEGDDSTTITYADRSTDTVWWSVGSTLGVEVVASVALATGVTLASIEAALLASIAGEFAALNVGDPLRYGRVFCALMDVAGVVGVTDLTLDGGTADVIPLVTQLIVASPDPVVT